MITQSKKQNITTNTISFNHLIVNNLIVIESTEFRLARFRFGYEKKKLCIRDNMKRQLTSLRTVSRINEIK